MLYNAWSRLIPALRRRRGLSQKKAAARAGVALITWWRWEKGEVSPRPRNLEAIAKALRYSPRKLGKLYSGILYRYYNLEDGIGETGAERKK